MNKTVSWLGWIVLFGLGCAGCAPKTSVIYLAHVNDTHGHIEPLNTNYAGSPLRVGGYPRIHSQIDAWRQLATQNHAGFLFLHAGDAWQGTAWFSLFHGMADLHLLNEMKLDAMVLGNHEFDRTCEITMKTNTQGIASAAAQGRPSPTGKHLAEFISSARFPILAANLDDSNNPVLRAQTNLVRSVIRDVNGQRVGIIGIVLEDMPSVSMPDQTLNFSSEIRAARQGVAALEEQGINRIIVLSHIGYSGDLRLAQEVEGIDVIVGGHSHTLLGEFSALETQSAGAYPTMVKRASGHRTAVVQAWADTRCAGLLKVTFNARGDVIDAGGQLCLLALPDNSVFLEEQKLGEGAAVTVLPEHPEDVRWIQTSRAQQIKNAYGPVIGTVETELAHWRIPHDAAGHGSQLAPLFAEGLIQELKHRNILVDIAILNAGSIRSPLHAGPLYQNSIPLNVMIFADRVTTFKLTGKQLTKVLESAIHTAVSKMGEEGCFPYVARLRYVYDDAQPAGQRFAVEILDSVTGWRPLGNDEIVRIAASDYLSTGHDHYDLLKTFIDQNSSRKTFPWSDSELVVDYLSRTAKENGGMIHGLDYAPVTVRNIRSSR